MKRFLMASVAAVALAAAPVAMQAPVDGGVDLASAYADDHGGKGGKGGKGYRGGRGAAGARGSEHSPGDVKDDDHSHDDHESGSDHGSGGRGGDHADGEDHEDHEDHEGGDSAEHGGRGGSDDRSGRGGGGKRSFEDGDARGGGQPAWSREGIPEVELGRLNVARSPDHVIDRAFDEVRSEFDPAASAGLYSMTAEEFAATVRDNWDTVTLVDSPLQNLGLYRDIREDGASELPGVTPATTTDLSAIFLGAASDKTMPISVDTVQALDTIMGLPALTDAEASALAAKAETVRQGIQTGHDASVEGSDH